MPVYAIRADSSWSLPTYAGLPRPGLFSGHEVPEQAWRDYTTACRDLVQALDAIEACPRYDGKVRA